MNKLAAASPHRLRTTARAGFTLVELLVVIAVIATLAGLLLSVSNRVQVATKKAACVSNLRQCGAAFGLYLSENNNTFPPNTGDPMPGDSKTLNRWVNYVSPYVANKSGYGWKIEIFHCPLAPKSKYLASAAGTSFGAYGYNQNFINSRAAEPPVRMSRIQTPSRVILLADANYNADVASSCLSRDKPCPGAANGAAANHRPDGAPLNGPDGACNYLFTDLHVETLMKWPKTDAYDPFLPYALDQ